MRFVIAFVIAAAIIGIALLAGGEFYTYLTFNPHGHH